MELRMTATRSGRLSSFLKGELRMSTGLMNKLKWGDSIRVNGVPQHTDFPVQIGDIVTVAMEEEMPEYPAQDGELSILYEDDFLLAVDKPAGQLIHPSRSKNDGTLANFVMGYYEKTGQKCAFHPVTRLDRDTFGVVLIAKSAYVHSLLQETKLQKTYHALTLGSPEADSGTIDAPIARKPLPSLLRFVSPEGKPSITEFQVLERTGETCLLALRPITGRTHQLRVHCAYCGFPILGDPQYGSMESQSYSQALGLTHQLLCAHSLCFVHPMTGEKITLKTKMDVRKCALGDEP